MHAIYTTKVKKPDSANFFGNTGVMAMAEHKREKQDFYDDGRIIADMSIDGMPGSIFRRKSSVQSWRKNDKTDDIKLTKEERRTIMQGVAASYIIFGVVFFGLFALFILFCIKIWFK